MSRYQVWAPYVPVAERRRKAAREMEKMRKKGHAVAPVIITGRTIATTFWGKAWCENLESYHDYENRLPRGRTYVRNGSVVDLQITPQVIQALVSGSSIYRVEINIKALPQGAWQALCADCSSGIDSLVELLQGRFNKGVMDRICRQDQGLFPKPSEIRFSCSCPDVASMCKHVAAVLYGVGSRLDEKPELLFLLRAVDQNDLVARLDTTTLPMAKQGPKAGKLLETDDVSQLFGLDMVAGGGEDTESKVPRSAVQSANRTPPTVKTPKRRHTVAEGDVGSTAPKAPLKAAPEAPLKAAKGADKEPISAPTAKNRCPAPVAKRKQDSWQEIENLISHRNDLGYVTATARLLDLRDSARNSAEKTEFSHCFAALRTRHERKSRFIERLDAAGLTEPSRKQAGGKKG